MFRSLLGTMRPVALVRVQNPLFRSLLIRNTAIERLDIVRPCLGLEPCSRVQITGMSWPTIWL